jgi:hypothetical protein
LRSTFRHRAFSRATTIRLNPSFVDQADGSTATKSTGDDDFRLSGRPDVGSDDGKLAAVGEKGRSGDPLRPALLVADEFASA